jgi:hypothetical protein
MARQQSFQVHILDAGYSADDSSLRRPYSMETTKPDQPKPGGSGWETKLREATGQMEEELRRLVTYVNDEVVPEVRRNGSAALRTAATELGKLAQRMEDSNRSNPPSAPPPPSRP